jgi:hypothetical protein
MYIPTNRAAYLAQESSSLARNREAHASHVFKDLLEFPSGLSPSGRFCITEQSHDFGATQGRFEKIYCDRFWQVGNSSNSQLATLGVGVEKGAFGENGRRFGLENVHPSRESRL